MFVLVCVIGLLLISGVVRGDDEMRGRCSVAGVFVQCNNLRICSKYTDGLAQVCELLKALDLPTEEYIEDFEEPTTEKLQIQSTTQFEAGPTTSPLQKYGYSITTQSPDPTPFEEADTNMIEDDGSLAIIESRTTLRVRAEITDPPVNITIPPGETARFSCRARGAPAPLTTITLRNDEVDQPVHEQVLSQRVTTVSVIQEIEDVTKQNEGWYRCLASNVWGSSHHDAYLRVADLCEGVVCPTRQTCQPDYSKGTAECVCPDCATSQSYDPVCGANCKSYFNRCLLHKDNCNTESDVAVLFNGICPETRPPRTVEINSGSQLYFTSGDGLDLTCSVSRGVVPSPAFGWVKDGVQVSSGSVLRIRSLSPSDTGSYHCEARQCGEVFSSEEVIVVVQEQDPTPTPSAGPDNLEIQKSVCTVFGDPHFITFDGYSYDHMGVCDYVLAMDCEYASWLVYGRTERCSASNTHGSCLNSVTVYSGRSAVELQRGWIINLGGRKMNITLDETVNHGSMAITFDGRNIRVALAGSDVEVVWDGLISVHILSPLGVDTCGMCGNNDMNPHNHLSNSRVDLASGDVVTIGDSWAVDRRGVCQRGIPNVNSRCSNTAKRLAKQRCEAAFKMSPLEKCAVDKAPYIAGCTVDVCTQTYIVDLIKPECVAVGTYVERCRLDSVRIYNWEDYIDCPRLYQYQDIVIDEGCPQDVERLLKRRVLRS